MRAMNPAIFKFMREHKWAVQASTSEDGKPQAAVVGIVVSDKGHIFFDTSSESRKAVNLRGDPRIALVIGWDHSQTLQVEGVVDEPEGDELAALKAIYFERFPDGRARESLPDTVYLRVRPNWMRYSDFRISPAGIRGVVLDGRHS